MQSFFKENGYVFSNNLNGHYTYGPLGKPLKTNDGFLELGLPSESIRSR
jgi:hypothetical protein